MLNILRNAAEAFDDALLDRERRVEITALQLDGLIRVRVRDNGVGFSPAVAAKLFGRGFSTKPRGSGLGLSGCRAILESHGAEMTLSSTGPGQGAEATLTLRCEAQ
jgi:signal transduction histidine kinase